MNKLNELNAMSPVAAKNNMNKSKLSEHRPSQSNDLTNWSTWSSAFFRLSSPSMNNLKSYFWKYNGEKKIVGSALKNIYNLIYT